MRGAGTTDGASHYPITGDNSGFTGTWVADGGRMWIGSANQLGAGAVDVRANGQLGIFNTFTAPTNITVTDSSGWRDNGFRLGAIRLEANASLSGNITLNQTAGVVLGDNSGLNAVISGWSAGNHVLSGVISGTGEFSMSRYTSWNGGTTQIVDMIVQGSEPNTYTGKTVVDGQGANASLWLGKGTGFMGGFAQAAGSPVAIPSGATITGISGYMGGGYVSATGTHQAIQGDTFGGVFTDGSVGWVAHWDGTCTKAVQLRINISGTTLTVTPLQAKYSNSGVNWISSLSNFDTGGNAQSLATTDAAAGYGAFNLKFAGAISSATAIPANTTVQMGSATGGQANLRMGLDNQFGPGVVMNFVNASGQWMRLDLEGTSQTLAGLNAGTATAQGGGVIQNQDVRSTVPVGEGTLTLNGSGTYLYNGYLRNQDNGGATRKLNLVKAGAGTQTLVGSVVNYSGATAVNEGTLVLQDTTAFASPTTVNAGGTLTAVRTTLGLAGRSPIMGNAISGTGTININNAGTGLGGGWTTVNGGTGSMTFSGTLNINSGVFSRDNTSVSTINTTATVNVAAGAFFGAGRGGNSTVGALNGDGVVSTLWGGTSAGSITVGNGNGNGDFKGVISGNGASATDGTQEGGVLSLIKVGTGTQTLSGANTYSGATTISQGVLKLANALAVQNSTVVNNVSGGLIFANPGSYTLGGFGGTANIDLTNLSDGAGIEAILGNNNGGGTYSGSLTGPGSVRKIGTTDVQYLDGANTYSGATTVNGGYLVARNNTALGTTDAGTVVNSGATLQLEKVPGGTDVTITAEAVTLNGNGVGGTRGALGNWTGNNTWAGPVTLGSSSIIYTNANADSLRITSGIGGAGNLQKSGGALTTGGNLIFGGTAPNTYAGTTILHQGNLFLDKTGAAAIPAGTIMQMGAVTADQPNLRMLQSNQFGEGVVMTFPNTSGNWGRFDLQGTTQTLAGISSATAALQGGVIQNERYNGGGTTAAGTLIINNTADYSYWGYIRDEDDGGNVYKLNLTKKGTGTQTIIGANIYYTGETIVDAGTLRVQDATALASPTTVNADGTLVWYGTGSWGVSSGATVSGAGTWQVTGPGASGAGHFDLNNNVSGFTGSLTIANARYWADSPIELPSASASINVTAGGQIGLVGAGTYSNAMTIAGNGWVEGAGVLGAIRFGGGANLTGNVTLADNARLTAYGVDDSGTISGVISGDYGVEKTGAGTLTLAGNNTYARTTTVNGGTLALDNGQINGGDVSVAANSTLAGRGSIAGNVALAATTQFVPGSAGRAGTLALGADLTLDATTTSRFELGATPTVGSGVNDYVTVGDTLTPNGSTIAIGFLARPANGTYRLIDAVAASGNFNPVLTGASATRKTFTLDDTTTAGQVDVVVAGPDYGSVTWTGATDGNWDTATNNWDNGGSADKFYDLDNVTFNDTGGAQSTVTVVGTVQPAAITVNHDGDYTFTGAGKISGPAGIVKSGTGTLTLGNTGGNDFLGGVAINQGVVKLGAPNSLPVNSIVTVADGAAFDFAGQGNTTTRNYSFSIAGAGPLGEGALTNSGAAVYGYSNVAKLVLTADASIGGVNRWDIGTGARGMSLDGGGFTLTKVGINEITVRPEFITNLAAVNVQAGTLKYEAYSQTTAATATTTHTVAAGAVLGTWGNITLNMPVEMNGGAIQSFNGTGTWSHGILLNSDTTVNASGGNIVLTGVLSGAGALTKTGGNALTLSNTNTYTGTTTASAGVLYLGANAPTVLGNVIMNGADGTYIRMQKANQFAPGVVGSFTSAWGAWNRFELFGNNQTLAGITTGNATTQGGGVIQNSEANGAAGADVTFTLNGDINADPAIYPVGGYVYNGHLRDFGGNTMGLNRLGLVKNGTGTQTLIGSVICYTGPTQVNNGTLVFSKTSALNTSITNAATVEINSVSGDDWVLANNNTLSGNGTWIKTGGGRATFANTTLTTSGQFQIQAGTLRNNNNASNWSGSTADVDISAGAILDLYADPIYVRKLTGAGIVQNGYGNASGQSGPYLYVEKLVVGVADASSTFSGVVRDNATNTAPASATAGGGVQLQKVGAGTLTLSGANTYSGGTTINAGTLEIGDGGTPGRGNVTNNAALVFNRSDNLTVSNVISGSGSVTKLGAGTVSLSSANTYTGATTISGGTLQLQPYASPLATGLRARFDASTLTGNSGDLVSAWADISGNGNNATRNASSTASYPQLAINAVNGLNAVRFSDDSKSWFDFNRLTDIRTVFFVGKQSHAEGADPDYHNFLGDVTNYHFHRGANDNLWYNGGDNLIVSNGTTRLNGTQVTATQKLGTAWNLLDIVTTGNANAGRIAYDRNMTNVRSWAGDIGEILIYNQALTPVEVQQVEAYLNYKWFGIGASNILPITTAVDITVAGAALDLNSINQTIGSLSGVDDSLVTLGTGNLTVGDAISTAFAGDISGDGALTKQGGGTLTLSGQNTYGGGTVVNAGTLAVASVTALPSGKSLTIGAGGTLVLSSGLSAGAGSSGASASSAAPVPEPGTLALLVVGALGGVVLWLRRKVKR